MAFNGIEGLELLSSQDRLFLACVLRGSGDHHETILSLEVALLTEDSEIERTHFLLGTQYHELDMSGEEYLPETVVKEIQRYRAKLGKQHPFREMENYFIDDSRGIIDKVLKEGGSLLPYGRASLVFTSYDALPNLAKAVLHVDRSRNSEKPMFGNGEDIGYKICVDFVAKYPTMARRLFSYLEMKI